MMAFAGVLPAAPRLRASKCDPVAAPYRLRISGDAPCFRSAAKSTRRTCLSDESFALRDIQFNNPQVIVLGCAAAQIIFKILFVFRVLNA